MNTLLEQAREQGALFNVRTEGVVSPSGVVAEGKQMIINESTNACIGVVSKKYKVVTNHEVVDHLGEALDRSALDLEGMEVKVAQSHGGARAMINVILPKHEIAIGGDKSRLQISVLNSYDGKWKYQSRAGAIRMACLNGQILGNFVGSYSEYHNSRLDVNAGAQMLVQMADGFEDAKDWWIAMMNRPVDQEQLVRSLQIFQFGKAMKMDKEQTEAFLNLPVPKTLVSLFETYSKEMGRNAYALYNAMTDFASHRQYRDDTHAAALLLNQNKIQRTVNEAELFAPA